MVRMTPHFTSLHRSSHRKACTSAALKTTLPKELLHSCAATLCIHRHTLATQGMPFEKHSQSVEHKPELDMSSFIRLCSSGTNQPCKKDNVRYLPVLESWSRVEASSPIKCPRKYHDVEVVYQLCLTFGRELTSHFRHTQFVYFNFLTSASLLRAFILSKMNSKCITDRLRLSRICFSSLFKSESSCRFLSCDLPS